MDDQKLGLTVFLLKSGQLENLKNAFLADQSSFALLPPFEGFFIPLPADQKPPGPTQSLNSLPVHSRTFRAASPRD